ncbi:MAG: hypothetical protein KDI35_07775, partial [Gammaproteobacteria bacterium]|nr:hypothetical protein [Gammaproteobacteria bacterium]
NNAVVPCKLVHSAPLISQPVLTIMRNGSGSQGAASELRADGAAPNARAVDKLHVNPGHYQ